MICDAEKGVSGIRFATPSDEDDIFHLLMLLHQENGAFTVNHAKVRFGIRHATQRQGGMIFVNEGPKVVASLGLIIAQDWYSDDEYLSERWNFVHPDHRRGTDYARRLIEQAKWVTDWFKAHGKILPLHIGIVSCDRTEAKIRLYARHMPCAGAFFIYGDVPKKEMSDKLAQAMRVVAENNRYRPRRIGSVLETVVRLGHTNV